MDLYSTCIVVPHTQGAQIRITLQCYLQITPYLPLPRKHSPDGASTDWGCGHLIAAYYSFIYPERMKGWVGLVGWPTADGLPTWSPVSRRDRRSNLPLCHATNLYMRIARTMPSQDVRLSVRPSHAGILSKQLNNKRHFFTIKYAVTPF